MEASSGDGTSSVCSTPIMSRSASFISLPPDSDSELSLDFASIHVEIGREMTTNDRARAARRRMKAATREENLMMKPWNPKLMYRKLFTNGEDSDSDPEESDDALYFFDRIETKERRERREIKWQRRKTERKAAALAERLQRLEEEKQARMPKPYELPPLGIVMDGEIDLLCYKIGEVFYSTKFRSLSGKQRVFCEADPIPDHLYAVKMPCQRQPRIRALRSCWEV